MDKLNIGPRAFLYPLPTTLVGANVNGKANYEAIAYCGVLNHAPPIIAVSSGRKHYTNVGIKENGTFSGIGRNSPGNARDGIGSVDSQNWSY